MSDAKNAAAAAAAMRRGDSRTAAERLAALSKGAQRQVLENAVSRRAGR
jgi:sirohydrochlorin ferrochelatase